MALVWRLWIIANGSLLVPVLLTIVVAYYGMVSLAETKKNQHEVIKPVLEHQTKLLEMYQKLLESKSANGK